MRGGKTMITRRPLSEFSPQQFDRLYWTILTELDKALMEPWGSLMWDLPRFGWQESKFNQLLLTNRLLCFKALSFVGIKQVERRILGFAILPLCRLPRALWHCAVRSLSMVSPETERERERKWKVSVGRKRRRGEGCSFSSLSMLTESKRTTGCKEDKGWVIHLNWCTWTFKKMNYVENRVEQLWKIM